MKFTPSTPEAIAKKKLWDKAIYQFVITDAEEKRSAKRGNEMIELTLEITRSDGATRTIRDWLLPQRPEKLMHACDALGLSDKYRNGVLSHDDFVAKSGRLLLGIQKKTKEFPSKNVVLDYLA